MKTKEHSDQFKKDIEKCKLGWIQENVHVTECSLEYN